MSDKLSKALVLYVFAPSRNSYQCKNCAYYFEGNCSQYKKQDAEVKEYGSCNLWGSNEGGAGVGTSDRTKADTGYMENKPGFGCRRCAEFVGDTKRCKKVDEEGGPNPGFISPVACCSRWEPDYVRAKLSDAALDNMKNFRL
jgi:hypothetical protein